MRTAPLMVLPLVFVLSACPAGGDSAGATPGDPGIRLDADGDGSWSEDDCDDTDPLAFPGATEVCDGVDNDCDDLVDEDGAPATWFRDADDDGYGTDADHQDACSAPEGYVAMGGDCNDHDDTISPAASEICDGVDQNCDGSTDEGVITTYHPDSDGDGFGATDISVTSCDPLGGYLEDGSDCADADPLVHPGAEEVCDGKDNDCDGDVDGGATDAVDWFADVDGDGFGSGPSLTVACSGPDASADQAGDCDDGNGSVNPAAVEACDDGLDNDCDGQAAECRWTGERSLGASDAEWTGEAADVAAGTCVSALIEGGDVDGDGLADLVASSPGYDADRGLTYVVGGDGLLGGGALGTGAAARLLGATAGDFSSRSSAMLGDWNDDGFADVVVGAYLNDLGGNNRGTSYVVFGPMTGDVDLATASDVQIAGDSNGDWSGYEVASAGDLDGDGVTELAVAAIGDDTTGVDAGAVYVFNGGSGVASGSTTVGTRDAVLLGVSAGDAAGYGVFAAGDVNGDGMGDLLVGASEASAAAGAAYLIEGPLKGSMGLEDADVTWAGEAAGDEAGRPVAGAGDVDGDGRADVLVGAPSNDATGTDAGAAYLFFGPPKGGTLGDAPVVWRGEVAGDQAGRALSAGDVDADGLSDIVIGAFQNDGGLTNAGATYAFHGTLPSGTYGLSAADAVFYGEAMGDNSGRALVVVGDLDADGGAELAVGAFHNDDGASEAGAVFLIPGGGF